VVDFLIQAHEQYDHWLAAITELLLALHALVGVALGSMVLLKRVALWTSTKEDDHALEAWSLRLARWHDWIARAQVAVPRLRAGKQRLPLVGTSIPPP
jgi:hypothetical protein